MLDLIWLLGFLMVGIGMAILIFEVFRWGYNKENNKNS